MSFLDPIHGQWYKVSDEGKIAFPFALKDADEVRYDHNGGHPSLVTKDGDRVLYKEDYVILDSDDYNFLNSLKLKKE
ncbi:MAG: hypothetical protein WAU36_06775 [Cyclobacteriaceae bacterium]